MFSKGFVAHAAGKATFTLSGQFTQFATCIGISKYAPRPNDCGVTIGDARFRVLGDGQVVRDWEAKYSPQDATCFAINITGVNQLVLETVLQGASDCDLSTWADARVSDQATTAAPTTVAPTTT